METLPVDTVRNPYSDRIGQRGYDAFDTVAWRPPTGAKFDIRAANDADPVLSHVELQSGVSAWLFIAGGAIVAAIVGALLGGALHI